MKNPSDTLWIQNPGVILQSETMKHLRTFEAKTCCDGHLFRTPVRKILWLRALNLKNYSAINKLKFNLQIHDGGICFQVSIQTFGKRSSLIFEGITSCWRELMKVWAFKWLESFSVFSMSYLADLILLAKEIVYFKSIRWRGKTPPDRVSFDQWIVEFS